MRKKRKQILFLTDRADEADKKFIIWLLLHFLLKFAKLCLSSEFGVFCPVSFFVSLVYTNSAFIYRVFKLTALKKTSSNVQAHSIARNILIKIPSFLLFELKSILKFSRQFNNNKYSIININLLKYPNK